MTPETNLAVDGVEQSILDWALDYGITPGIIIGRLDRGASVADAITMPMQVAFRGQRLPHAYIDAAIRRDASASNRIRTAVIKSAPVSRGKPPKGFSHGGRTMSIAAWSRFSGIRVGTLRSRLATGWTFERAISDHRLLRGVAFNSRSFAGTGGGSTLQESTNITFSEEASR